MSAYKFIDVSYIQPDAPLPAEAMSYNGVYIENEIPGYRTLYVEGRERIEASVSTIETNVRHGGRYKRRKYGSRTITVGFQLLAESDRAFRDAFNRLLYLLSAEQAQVIFNDEPDKYYVGTKTGIGDIPHGTNKVAGTIEIFCADPFKYSVDKHTVYAETGSDGTVYFSVDYGGTFPAYPVITAQAENQSGYYGFTTEDGAQIEAGDKDTTTAFLGGDKVVIDAAACSITVNGADRASLGALGNQWEEFLLKPGANRIICAASETAGEVSYTMDYREAFL